MSCWFCKPPGVVSPLDLHPKRQGEGVCDECARQLDQFLLWLRDPSVRSV